MAAKVNSATGTALAAAAEVTTTPRSQRASLTMGRTVPAAWATIRRAGNASSTGPSSRGQPHPVISTATVLHTLPVRSPGEAKAVGATRSTANSSRARAVGAIT